MADRFHRSLGGYFTRSLCYILLRVSEKLITKQQVFFAYNTGLVLDLMKVYLIQLSQASKRN